jgi:homoserine dehydrogenase
LTEIKLGIAGLGTVAQGVLALIRRNGALMAQRSGVTLRVVRIASRREKPGVDLMGAQFSTDLDDLVSDPDVDVILELIGGEGVALDLIRRALASNTPVVTANKAVLAAHGNELMSGARQAAAAFRGFGSRCYPDYSRHVRGLGGKSTGQSVRDHQRHLQLHLWRNGIQRHPIR